MLIGRSSGTTDSNGYLTISHGGSATPIGVIACIESSSDFRCVANTRGPSVFRVRVFDTTGAAYTARAVSITWIAVF